jgi:hypothetical protein
MTSVLRTNMFLIMTLDDLFWFANFIYFSAGFKCLPDKKYPVSQNRKSSFEVASDKENFHFDYRIVIAKT